MDMENAFRALNQSFDKDGIEISQKTENSLLMWFGDEQESDERNNHVKGDAVKKVSAHVHSKSEPKSFSPIKIFFWVGAFACVVGYFGWLEKNTKPFETPLASELSPPVDDFQSIELSPDSVSKITFCFGGGGSKSVAW